MCICPSVCTGVQVLLETRRDPGAGVTGSCEPHDTSTELEKRATEDSVVCPWWDDSPSF